jgi:EamA-like transporter family
VTTRGAVSLGFLVVAGTVLGFGAYTWLLRVSTPAAVGTYAFVNPVVALGLAWAVGDEPFSLRTIAAAMTVVAAVLLIWKSSRAGQKPRLVVNHQVTRPSPQLNPTVLWMDRLSTLERSRSSNVKSSSSSSATPRSVGASEGW